MRKAGTVFLLALSLLLLSLSSGCFWPVPFTPRPDEVSIEIIPPTHVADAHQAEVTVGGPRHLIIGWGSVDRDGSVFSADATVRELQIAKPLDLAIYSEVYELGVLQPGVYTFKFYANGEFMADTDFSVEE